MLLTPAQIKPKSFELRQNFFFIRGGCVLCLSVCLGTRLLPQSYQYPSLSEGTDCINGQLRGDKECPSSGVTNLAEFQGRSQKAKLGVCRTHSPPSWLSVAT